MALVLAGSLLAAATENLPVRLAVLHVSTAQLGAWSEHEPAPPTLESPFGRRALEWVGILLPVPQMVRGLSSAPSGRCTVWQCTMCGPDSFPHQPSPPAR